MGNDVDGHDDEAREGANHRHVVDGHDGGENEAQARALFDLEEQERVGKVVVDAEGVVGRFGKESSGAAAVFPGGGFPAFDEEIHHSDQGLRENVKGLKQAHEDVGRKDVEEGAVDVFELLVLDVDDGEKDNGGVYQRHKGAQRNGPRVALQEEERRRKRDVAQEEQVAYGQTYVLSDGVKGRPRENLRPSQAGSICSQGDVRDKNEEG